MQILEIGEFNNLLRGGGRGGQGGGWLAKRWGGWKVAGGGRGCNNIERYRSLIRHAAREREIRSTARREAVLAIFSSLLSFLSRSFPLSLSLILSLILSLSFSFLPLPAAFFSPCSLFGRSPLRRSSRDLSGSYTS